MGKSGDHVPYGIRLRTSAKRKGAQFLKAFEYENVRNNEEKTTKNNKLRVLLS